MSLLSELNQLEERVAQRLAELAPLAKEYDELRRTAERLGVSAPDARRSPVAKRRASKSPSRPSSKSAAKSAAGETPAARTPAAKTPVARASAGEATTTERQPTAKPARRNRSQPARKQAGASRGGARQQELLELVQRRPGISVAEAAKQLKVDPTSLYRPLRLLQSQGSVTKTGRELNPA